MGPVQKDQKNTREEKRSSMNLDELDKKFPWLTLSAMTIALIFASIIFVKLIIDGFLR